MSLPIHVSNPSTTARRSGPWHRRVEGLHVLKLVGTHYEMGRQHGEMLRDAIPRGPIPYYRSYLEHMLGRTGVGPLAPLAWPLVQRLLGDRVVAAFPDYARDSIRGMAHGSGISEKELLEGCALPDSLLWVAARVMKLRDVGPAVHHRVALGLGCTSAIAWDGASADGRMLHARNLDYHGVDCWPKTSAVIFHEPEQGLRYVSVSAAGVLMGGVTAMNEAGLSLTVHQHMFTDQTRLGGTPIGCVGDVIMREARNLDDAITILRRQRPIGCWTYLITDGRRREMLCWEEDPQRNRVVRRGNDDGVFGYSNIYLDPELGSTEQALYGSYWRHNQARYERVNAMLQDGFGEHTPSSMAAMLGDQGNGPCRISEAIGMLMTVGSVVFRPEDGVLWVASGQAPTSHGRFLPFDLDREDHAPEHGELTPASDQASEARQAFARYRDAYVAYVDEDDVEAAYQLSQQAADLQPEQPLFAVLAGLVAMKLGRADEAFARFDRALALGHPHPERLAAFHLWRGHAADLVGKRAEATADYRRALGHQADEPVRRAARRGLRRPYRSKRVRGIDVDFTYVDVIRP
jgi:Acyl-coenzyme A:6-aminopenicillanic acid acyl-transferase